MAEQEKRTFPFVPDRILRERAEEVRGKHWNNDDIPVDVELIVEKMGYEIIPTDALQEFEAFLNVGNTAIFVNGRKYDNPSYSKRVRFSIAHELGHAILHADFLQRYAITSIDEYMEFIHSLKDEDYSAMEYQANEFAGRLLVPKDPFIREMGKSHQLIRDHGLSHLIKENPGQLLASIAVKISRVFDISEQVIQLRAEREGLWPPS
jgi:Zn-dependent peptidase ImmA (M78 family)